MKLPIHIQTAYGMKVYKNSSEQFNMSKNNGTLAELKANISAEKKKVDRELNDLIYNEESQAKFKMNDRDKQGWKMFKELADKYTVLNYFESKGA